MVGTQVPSQVESRRLVRRARLELEQADTATDERIRFLHAHMAGIRAGAAVVSLVPAARPAGRRRMTSVWEQLAAAGQPWDEWAAQLGAGAPLRAAIEAGRMDALEGDVAEGAVALAEAFVVAVEEIVDHRGTTLTTAIAS